MDFSFFFNELKKLMGEIQPPFQCSCLWSALNKNTIKNLYSRKIVKKDVCIRGCTVYLKFDQRLPIKINVLNYFYSIHSRSQNLTKKIQQIWTPEVYQNSTFLKVFAHKCCRLVTNAQNYEIHSRLSVNCSLSLV